MSWELPVVGEGVIEPVSAVDCAVYIRGEGIVVQARNPREMVGERSKRVTKKPVSLRKC